MKEIRFVNPIKECMEVQGKGYTVSLVATIIATFMLSIVAAVLKMPVESAVSGIVAIGSTAWYGWWFGTQQWANPSSEDD